MQSRAEKRNEYLGSLYAAKWSRPKNTPEVEGDDFLSVVLNRVNDPADFEQQALSILSDPGTAWNTGGKSKWYQHGDRYTGRGMAYPVTVTNGVAEPNILGDLRGAVASGELVSQKAGSWLDRALRVSPARYFPSRKPGSPAGILYDPIGIRKRGYNVTEALLHEMLHRYGSHKRKPYFPLAHSKWPRIDIGGR